MRSQARESVFKYIFSRLFNPSDEGLFTVLTKELGNEDKVFAQNLLSFIDGKYAEYGQKIADLAINYHAERIFAADKCAILIGMAELDNFPETDIPVIIDEAVKLSAKFSAEKSTDFVNGILAEYAKEIR